MVVPVSVVACAVHPLQPVQVDQPHFTGQTITLVSHHEEHCKVVDVKVVVPLSHSPQPMHEGHAHLLGQEYVLVVQNELHNIVMDIVVLAKDDDVAVVVDVSVCV